MSCMYTLASAEVKTEETVTKEATSLPVTDAATASNVCVVVLYIIFIFTFYLNTFFALIKLAPRLYTIQQFWIRTSLS